MAPEDTRKQLEDLREENRRLRQELEHKGGGLISYKSKLAIRKVLFSISSIVAGKGLRKSLNRLYAELPHNVSKDTVADVSANVIWRITRIGIFAIAAAVIPILVLLLQTTILDTQNEKLDYQNQLIYNQNVRLDQQVQLDEGNRRSSFVFLMSNVMDKIDEELKNAPDGSRRLSEELIGRIAALSQALLPYRYLENDELTPGPLSPERGQLLFALVNSLLDETTYDKIFEKSNFSYAELKQANFTGAYLRNVNLEYAHFPDAVFSNADLEYAKLKQADLSDTHFENVNMVGAQLQDASFRSAEIVNVDFSNANLSGVDFRLSRINGNFTACRLDDVHLDSAEIEFALLEEAHFQSKDWLSRLEPSGLRGFFSIRDNYEVEAEAVISSSSTTDSLYRLRLKEDSHLAMMGECEKIVLDLVKSAPDVEALIQRTQRQGEQIIYLTEANPFGAPDLDIVKDSVYLFRITTEDADFLSALMWIQFHPASGRLMELPLTDGEKIRELEYNRKLWEGIPNYCW
ncbi:MAG: pentapeptide repeat-containing protein [Saprospiraceae bacterium]|nr:pentapeptide repeat-containing protein [Lewinella sp.]